MRRLSWGAGFTNARVRVVILSFAALSALISSADTYALSVDPVLNTVISVLRPDKSKATEPDAPQNATANESRRANISPSTSSSSNRPSEAPTASSLTTMEVPEATIITEPIEQLPTLSGVDVLPKPVYTYQSISTLTVSPAVLGVTTTDSISPLQASNQGWKVFGIAWYWWVVGGLATYFLTRRIAHMFRAQRSDNNPIVS